MSGIRSVIVAGILIEVNADNATINRVLLNRDCACGLPYYN